MNMRLLDAALIVVGIIASLANYEGLSLTLRAETVWQHTFCAVIALGVFAGITIFWHAAFHVVPKMQNARLRVGAWATTFVGALCILGMSAWWSVAAIGGAEAQHAAYEGVVAQAEKTFATSRAGGGAVQALVPGLEALTSDLGNLADCERKSGCITSVGHEGGVSALLGQLQDKAAAILKAADGSRATLGGTSDKAAAFLASMRAALSASGSIRQREDELSRQVDGFNAALADLGNADGSAAIAQALATFTTGIVVPVDIRTDKQREAVQKILAGIRDRTAALAQAAQAVAPAAALPPVAMVRLNAMEAVMRHWRTVLPAWVTGICLDLGPLALLMFITLRTLAERGAPEDFFHDRPIRDVLVLKRVLSDLDDAPQRRPTAKGLRP